MGVYLNRRVELVQLCDRQSSWLSCTLKEWQVSTRQPTPATKAIWSCCGGQPLSPLLLLLLPLLLLWLLLLLLWLRLLLLLRRLRLLLLAFFYF